MAEKKRIFRNEWKFIISKSEGELLRRRLSPFLSLDAHSDEGGYEVRSLYFDDYKNTAYVQKLMGVYKRQKWRVRIYNYSDKEITLERKIKEGSYVYKESADITREEFEKIMDGEFGFLLKREENLCREFYLECVSSLMRPKVIVDYNRIPLIHDEGTVRITFDRDIAAAVGGFDIFDPELPKLTAIEPGVEILEVKYTEFLPEIIRKLLPAAGQEFVAFSKYVSCYDAAHQITDVTAGISKTGMIFRNRGMELFI